MKFHVPGATLPHVHTMRGLADSNALIARAKTARRCVVVGDGARHGRYDWRYDPHDP
jgi:NAD(P)H-nitrite reductase large subunit